MKTKGQNKHYNLRFRQFSPNRTMTSSATFPISSIFSYLNVGNSVLSCPVPSCPVRSPGSLLTECGYKASWFQPSTGLSAVTLRSTDALALRVGMCRRCLCSDVTVFAWEMKCARQNLLASLSRDVLMEQRLHADAPNTPVQPASSNVLSETPLSPRTASLASCSLLLTQLCQ